MGTKMSTADQYLGAKKLVSIYKTSHKDGMYLYVPKGCDLQSLDEGLLHVFKQPQWVMDILLSSEKKLARVDCEAVLAGLQAQGFYLQMPPPKEDTDMLISFKSRIG